MFKNFEKIARRITWNGHSTSKCTVKMCVRTKEAGHNQTTICIDVLGIGILLAQERIRIDGSNAIIMYQYCSPLDQSVFGTECDDGSIANEDIRHIFRPYCPTFSDGLKRIADQTSLSETSVTPLK